MNQLFLNSILTVMLLTMCIACSDFSGSDVKNLDVNEHVSDNLSNLILQESTNATAKVTVLKSYSTETEVGFRYPSSGPDVHVTPITFNSFQNPSVIATIIVHEINNDPNAKCSAVSLGNGEVEFTSNFPGTDGNNTAMIIEVDDDGSHFSSYTLNFSGGVD